MLWSFLQFCLHNGPNFLKVRAFLAFVLLLEQLQRPLCNGALFAQMFLFAVLAKLALGRPRTPFPLTPTAQARRFARHASHTEVNLPSQHS